jgi:GxxExxY protein
MDAKDAKILHKDLSYTMLGLAMQVHRELGFGFLEKEYENALMVLLGKESIKATQQAPILVSFRGEVVGAYYADILVEDKIIVELKSVDRITDVHRTQALNYLKATGMKQAVILNFGKESLQYERLAY